MDARTARYVQIGLGLLLVAVIAGAVLLSGPTGERTALPDPIERVVPADGSQMPRQQPVVVDLAIGYDATIFVEDRAAGEWVPVPADQVAFEPATGVLTWTPPPDIAPSGQFRLRVEYRATTGLPETGSYEWSIRTY